MLLVTRGCGDVKSNGKGRLREKLLDKAGLFIKDFCFIHFLLGIFIFFFKGEILYPYAGH